MLSVILTVVLIVALTMPAGQMSVWAKKGGIKLSAKKVTLTVGKTKKLKLQNAKKNKVTWTSSKKKVATVGKKTGKVVAKKAGKTVITAKYKGKKYKCTVTVVKKKNDGGSDRSKQDSDKNTDNGQTQSGSGQNQQSGGSSGSSGGQSSSGGNAGGSGQDQPGGGGSDLNTEIATPDEYTGEAMEKPDTQYMNEVLQEEAEAYDSLLEDGGFVYDRKKGAPNEVASILRWNPGNDNNPVKVQRRKTSGSSSDPEVETEIDPSYYSYDWIYSENGYYVTIPVENAQYTVIGNTERNGFCIEFPEGTLGEDRSLTLTCNKAGGLSIQTEPLNTEDQKANFENGHLCLKQGALISFKLENKVTKYDMTDYRGVFSWDYTGADQEERSVEIYLTPDEYDLADQVITYTVYHLSDEAPAKFKDQKEAFRYAAHLEAIERYAYDSGKESEMIDAAVKNLSQSIVDALGIKDTSDDPLYKGSGKEKTIKAVSFALSNGGNIYKIIRAAREDPVDTATITSTLSEVTLNALIDDAEDKIPGFGYLTTTVGTLPDVTKSIKEGQYTDAMNHVLKALADSEASVQYIKFCDKIVDSSAQIWTDTNMEEMYNLYAGKSVKQGTWRDYKSRSGIYEGDWEGLTTGEMGAFNAYINQRYRQYAKGLIARGLLDTEYEFLHYSAYQNERDALREKWMAELKKQFDARKENEEKIAKEEERIEKNIAYFEEAGLFGHIPENACKNTPYDRVQYLFKIRSNIEKLLQAEKIDLDTLAGVTPNMSVKTADEYRNYYLTDIMMIWMQEGNNVAGRLAAMRYIQNHYAKYALNASKLKMKEKQTATLKLFNCQNKRMTEVRWESADSGIATVDSNGKVTAVSGGKTVVTCYHGDIERSCAVEVEEAVAQPYVAGMPKVVMPGQSDIMLEVRGVPDDGTKVTWKVPSPVSSFITITPEEGTNSATLSASSWSAFYGTVPGSQTDGKTIQVQLKRPGESAAYQTIDVPFQYGFTDGKMKFFAEKNAFQLNEVQTIYLYRASDYYGDDKVVFRELEQTDLQIGKYKLQGVWYDSGDPTCVDVAVQSDGGIRLTPKHNGATIINLKKGSAAYSFAVIVTTDKEVQVSISPEYYCNDENTMCICTGAVYAAYGWCGGSNGSLGWTNNERKGDTAYSAALSELMDMKTLAPETSEGKISLPGRVYESTIQAYDCSFTYLGVKYTIHVTPQKVSKEQYESTYLTDNYYSFDLARQEIRKQDS